MKKTLLLLVVTVSYLTSCKQSSTQNSLNDRAKDSVVAYLKANLNDPSSYQSVAFDSVERRTTQPPDTLALSSSAMLASSSNHDITDNFELYKKRSDNGFYKRQEKHYIDSLKQIVKIFKPILIGYDIRHKYRAKNGMGALMLSYTAFKLDTNLKVLEAEEIK